MMAGERILFTTRRSGAEIPLYQSRNMEEIPPSGHSYIYHHARRAEDFSFLSSQRKAKNISGLIGHRYTQTAYTDRKNTENLCALCGSAVKIADSFGVSILTGFIFGLFAFLPRPPRKRERCRQAERQNSLSS